MKKLLFILCMISAFGVSSIAQIVINPPSDPPMNNVIRWMRNGDPYSRNNLSKHFPYFNDFLGGYDMSTVYNGEIYSYYSIDLSTYSVGNMFLAINFNTDGSLEPDIFGNGTLGIGTVSFGAWWVNMSTYESGEIPSQYTEETFNEDGKCVSGLGSLTMTSDCIPTSNNYYIEVSLGIEIAWDNGMYSCIAMMYDFSQEGFENLY